MSKNILVRDGFEDAVKVAESKGKKLVWIGNGITGEFLGYRLTNNKTMCHSERVVSIGKIRKLLGMSNWVYIGGVATATYANSEIAKVIN